MSDVPGTSGECDCAHRIFIADTRWMPGATSMSVWALATPVRRTRIVVCPTAAMMVGEIAADAIRKGSETEADRITDLHLWQLDPGH